MQAHRELSDARIVGAAQDQGRTLIFHIGDHKTGTTTIQHAFATRLVRIGGVQPLYTASLSHNHLPQLFRAVLRDRNSPTAEKGRQVIAGLAAKIAASDAPICVISAESFEGFDPAGLRRILDEHFAGLFDRIRIIAYVRPHLQRFVSGYAERTKIGILSGDMESFFQTCLAHDVFRFAPRFRKWRKVFGADFVLRPFVRTALIDGSLMTDFIRSAVGDVPFTVDPTDNQNESLSLEDLLRVKYLHAQIKGRSEKFHHNYGWALTRMLGDMPRPETATRIRLHRSLAERAAEHFRPDARRLDEAFFPADRFLEQALSDDVAAACELPQLATAEAMFSPSEMRSLDMTGRLIAEMLDNGKTPWAEHFHRRRLEHLHGAES